MNRSEKLSIILLKSKHVLEMCIPVRFTKSAKPTIWNLFQLTYTTSFQTVFFLYHHLVAKWLQPQAKNLKNQIEKK